MILCLAVEHASIFHTLRQAFVIKLVREASFMSLISLYLQIFWQLSI